MVSDGAALRSRAPAPASGEPLDLRLALGAACAWVVTVLCLTAAPSVVLAVALASVVVAVAALRLHRRRAAASVALCGFVLALVLLPLAARLAHASTGALYLSAQRHAAVQLRATVAGDPFELTSTGLSGTQRVAVPVRATSVLLAGRDITSDGAVLVLGDAAGWRGVLPGQTVEVAGTLQPDLSGSRLSVTLFERGPPELLGTPPWWQRAAGAVRGSLARAAHVLPEQDAGLLPGLVDGDTSGLDPVLAEHFRIAGLTHLVAVSGTNCSLLLGVVLLTARRLRARRAVQVAVGLAVLAAFVVVARPSPSVLRAAVMALIALGALGSGRPRAGVPLLAAATVALLVWDPTLASSASFAMSVLATAALLLLAPPWARRLRDRGVPAGVAESVAVAAAAHIVTAPVVAAISGQVSLVAVFANVAAEPAVALVTVLGFAGAVVAPWWLGGGELLVWLAGWPCRWLVVVADFFGGLHGATVPWPGGVLGGVALLGALLVVAAAALRAGVRRVLVAVSALALVLLIPVRAVVTDWPPPGWLFVACDVGQGDALLLPSGPGAAVEVDAGPDPVAIDRCLNDFGITHIATLILSHDHLDHVGGLPGVLRGRTVDRVLTGPLAEPVGGAEIVARAGARAGLPVQTPPPGTHLDVGDTSIDVLGPAAALHGTRSDPNNSSLVLRATVRGVRILLPGDAELEEQRAVLESGVDLRADILKVPHHGSAYSLPDFLAAAHAQVAVVSVGLHNDYGHPSPILLNEMARLGVPLLRTGRDGDVAFTGTPGDVHAVLHGTRSSTVGVGPGIAGLLPPSPGGLAVSPAGARMAACRLAPSASTTSPTRSRRCSCWSARRSCSSSGPPARSPPRPGGPTRHSSRPP